MKVILIFLKRGVITTVSGHHLTHAMEKTSMRSPGGELCDVCNIDRSGGNLLKELSKSIYVGTRKMVNYA